MAVINSIADRQDEMRAWRHLLHQHPELSYEEVWTSNFVAEKLASFGLEVHRGMGKTGVVGILHGTGTSSRAIGLRADMDALPIQETDNHSYSSKNNGVMHACGHDGHMAILLGAAKALSKTKNSLSGTVRFIFQPAEEGGGGARHMIEEGCLDGVSEIYGIHLWNYQPVGEVGVKDGPILAAADMFDITIKGTVGHGATPQGTVDTIVVSSQLVQAFQTIISRNTNPIDNAVITIVQGRLHNTPTHLTSTSVYAVDGTMALGTFTTSGSNTITLNEAHPAGVNIGFDYTPTLETMPIDKELPEGPLTGLPRRISRAIVDLNSTLDMTIKAADSTSKALVIQQVNFQGGSDLIPVTAKKEFFFLGYDKSPTVTISQDDPLPIKILGMSVEVVFA